MKKKVDHTLAQSQIRCLEEKAPTMSANDKYCTENLLLLKKKKNKKKYWQTFFHVLTLSFLKRSTKCYMLVLKSQIVDSKIEIDICIGKLDLRKSEGIKYCTYRY